MSSPKWWVISDQEQEYKRRRRRWFVLCALSFSVCVKLRAAGEYEERKMIRAAIRQIRDEQQQGDACFHSLDNNMEAVVLFVILI